MKKIIEIEDIEKTPDKKLRVNFEEFIEGIKSNEPIKAELELISLGDFIEVKGSVFGHAVLECDLCLDEFNYLIDFDIEELLAKNAFIQESGEYGAEIELKEGEFVTDLRGSRSIDINDLLYQSVILDFPNKKVCGINCKGNNFVDDENYVQSGVDPRLAVFKNINIENKKPTI